MAKGLAILALLVLCELSSVAAASQHLADKEATMAGAAQARDADETDTDGEEGTDDSEGLEDANGRANGRAEQGGGDPDDSEEDVGDDNDDMMDGLPPLEEEHAYYSSLDNNKGACLPKLRFPTLPASFAAITASAASHSNALRSRALPAQDSREARCV